MAGSDVCCSQGGVELVVTRSRISAKITQRSSFSSVLDVLVAAKTKVVVKKC